MSAIQQAFVAIIYIGFRQFWEDTIYGTGLTFEKGQVRNVPPSIAMRLLRHSDAFREHKQADYSGDTSQDDTGQQDHDEQTSQDDTQELLEQAEKQEQEHKDDANRNYEALQMIDNLSTKAAVAEFAETHYQAKINQRLSLDNMRAELRALVEKFGVR